jgi:drug/metabolite transporter (DMT)-like permease
MHSRIGIALMVVAALFYGCMNICVKLSGSHLTIWQTGMARFLLGVALMPVLSRMLHLRQSAKELRLLLTRGVSGTIAFLLLIQAMMMIPLSIAMVLFYLWPAFTCLLSPWVAGEPTPKREWPLVVCALVGTAVILWPEKGGPGLSLGHFLALGSSAFAGHAVILIRRLRRSNDAFTIYYYYCVAGGLITAVPLLAQTGPILPDTNIGWLYLSAVAFFAMVAQVVMNEGMKYLDASRTGALMTIEIITAAAFGALWLGGTLTARFFIGSILILGSGAALMVMPRKAPAGNQANFRA